MEMIRVGSLCAAGQELSRSHYGQVELSESAGITGDLPFRFTFNVDIHR